eukprot:CAMPEP_0171342406 /NCGR_PEP_ID=MMETSP0878-20121228/14224_1 /TAXON_ID=67004 /ORGANISM="Thalassiosira weissflogii, Strain CCMP1336" /LENGTH=1813 /DNA_ID=CAMNT_0011845061 /DNA_START=84 /DNA_END=5525 /DNA_ORIENTATION=-
MTSSHSSDEEENANTTTAAASPAPRRSTRSRRPVSSVYDEARLTLSQESEGTASHSGSPAVRISRSGSKSRSRRKDEDDDDDDDDDDDNHGDGSDDDGSENEEDAEEGTKNIKSKRARGGRGSKRSNGARSRSGSAARSRSVSRSTSRGRQRKSASKSPVKKAAKRGVSLDKKDVDENDNEDQIANNVGRNNTDGDVEEEEEMEEVPLDEEDEDQDDDEGQENQVEDDEQTTTSSSSESDEEFGNQPANAKKTPPRKAAAGGAKSKVQIQIGKNPEAGKGARGTATAAGGRKSKALTARQRAINASLAALARTCLPPSERSPSLHNLIAGVLYSFRPASKGLASSDVGGVLDGDEDMEYRQTSNVTDIDMPYLSPYSQNLQNLASKVIRLHNANANQAQILLLNLLFRSVGGSPMTDLPWKDGDGNRADVSDDEDVASESGNDRDDGNGSKKSKSKKSKDTTKAVILDDLDTNDWGRIITDLVDDMRHAPAHQILMCADPLGAVHQAHVLSRGGQSGENDEEDHRRKKSAKDTQYSMGVQEFRKIYKEFWYTLGYLALSQGGMATTSSNLEDTDPSSGKEINGNSEVVRLDTESAKDIISRIIEMAPVGQPDVRAAATLAALSMSHAILDWSAQLVKKVDVATRQYNAVKRTKGGGKGAKAEGLKIRIDSLKRSVQDLEEAVLGPVVQGLFVHRYRDSNEHIRTMCIETLSRWCLQRPDIFLTDKYLKYFGWLMHDKHPNVRVASITGLLQPFLTVHDAADGKPRALGDEHLMMEKIDLASLEHVVAKFLGRITEEVTDVNPEVQEAAMSLMLMLLKDGFLDDVNDDKVWNRVNLRALARDAPPKVRRDALYFILEQLEAFDEGDDEKESPGRVELSERKRAQQLDAIASYAAHAMTNGDIPIDKIQVDLADFLVQSLRDMPEHKILVSDWNSMLRAIKDDNAAKTAHNVRAGERANVAKQRVLVRMLCHAVREEVSTVADENFLLRGVDAEVVARNVEKKKSVKPRRKATSMSREHENLSIAMLKALPNLLMQFKGDSAVTPELAKLPRYIIPTVFSLPQRKQEFMSLIKNLGDIYVSSSDTQILTNTAQSIVSLSKGDHGRVSEATAQIRNIVTEIRDRLVDLLSSDDSTVASSALSVTEKTTSDVTSRRSSKRRSRKRSAGDCSSIASSHTSLTDESSARSVAADTEYSIFLNLKRLRILSQKIDLFAFFENTANDKNQLELLCSFVGEALKRRLHCCRPMELRGDDASMADSEYNKVIDSPDVLAELGKAVQEGLELILCVTGWSLLTLQNNENLVMNDDDIIGDVVKNDPEDNQSIEDNVVLRLRNQLLSLLQQCYAQYLPSSEERDDDETSVGKHSFSSEQIAFADFVQMSAGKVASDLRVLFPKEYADAASPILRSLALVNDDYLVAGNFRFIGSKAQLLLSNDAAEKENKTLPYSLLLPTARAVVNNWNSANRREAGLLLNHITSSGPTTSELITTAVRTMKKIDSIRLLESQMASLKGSYETWVDEEPEVESDRPTEQEMAEFEQAEKKHREQFATLEQRASLFSQALGNFGKLSDDKLRPALNGFIREGIRFSFSNLDNNGEDTLVLGSRLNFLLFMSKYAGWIKRNKKSKDTIQECIDELETNLRNHEEFGDVHEDDLSALESFRKHIGLKPLVAESLSVATRSLAGKGGSDDTVDEESKDSLSDLATPTSTISKSKGRRSSTSTLKSRSSLNLSSTLPPLLEGEEETPPRSDDESHTDNDEQSDGEQSNGEERESSPPSVANSKRTCLVLSHSHLSDSYLDDSNDDENTAAAPRSKKSRSK